MSFLEKIAQHSRKLGFALLAIVLLIMGFNTVRNTRVDALGRAALDKKADPAVVKKLASYSGQRAAEWLMLVAGGAPAQENRLAAIQLLVDRKAAPEVSRLSELLLPTESLPVRQAVASAIYKTGCSPECVRNVLYYQERIWRGDRPAEDTQAEPPQEISEPEKELRTSLDEVLKKNKQATGLVLTKVYGLATDFPSPFAVETVERLDLKEACPLLMHTYLSVKDNVRASPEFKQVSEAVKTLGCPGSGQ